jgi:hypothetical protein
MQGVRWQVPRADWAAGRGAGRADWGSPGDEERKKPDTEPGFVGSGARTAAGAQDNGPELTCAATPALSSARATNLPTNPP